MTPQLSTTYAGDCLNVMRSWPDKCVDLVFCSPPYEAARTYGVGFKLTGQDWVDWAVDRFMECLRVCRGLVAWNVEGQTRGYRYSATPALFMADLHRRGVHLRKPPIFHRNGIPGSGGPDWLRNDWEWIVCGTSGGKLPWSDPTAMGHIPKWAPGGEMSNRQANGARRNKWGKSPQQVAGSKTGNRKQNGERENTARASDDEAKPVKAAKRTAAEKLLLGEQKGTSHDADGMRPVVYLPPALANPGNVIKCNVGGGLMGHELAHENEAPFPLPLAEFFVRSFCPPGGTTLDCFMGSGTTAHACEKWGRKWVGIDIRESQVKLASRRLSQVGQPLFYE